MIEKMTKYTLVSLSSFSEEFISSLGELGVMDIRRSHKSIDGHSAGLLEEAAEIKSEMAGTALKEGIASCKSAMSSLNRELQASRLWGDYDPSRISALEKAGYSLHFHRQSRKAFDPSIMENAAVEVISEGTDGVLFIVIGENTGIAGEISRPRPVAEIEEDIRSRESELAALNAELDKLPSKKKELQAKLDAVLNSFEAYMALRGNAAEGDLGNFVNIYEGFAPTKDDAAIAEKLDTLPVYYVAEAAKEDNTPIKLKNKKFFKEFEVLTGMYGMPVYSEFDPTPILGPFFLLFFSLCMGDAGYGILLMLISVFLAKKMPESGLGKLHNLIMFLGAGTFIIGIVLGTFFGIDLYAASWVPDWLKAIMVKGNLSLGERSFDIQMVMAIGIGVFHICLAMVVKAICYTRRFGFKECISIWGWLILILGALCIGGLALSGVIDSAVTKIAVIVVGTVSALGIFIFNKPGRNPLLNIGSGLWDTYNMVTGLLGDVLSYIRLYALGLAGGMLGAAFNNLGEMVLGDGSIITWFFFILILIIGHALNLAMSCLGAFVHPLRLSFVEYFKNSGYEGRGIEYKPLKNK